MSIEKDKLLDRFFRHPWIIVFVTGILTVFFAFQLPKAELDNNNIRFIPEDNEARLTSQYIDDNFGSSLFILVGLERRYGDIFDPSFLNRIREFTVRMEDLEIVGDVNSIISSDYISGTGDSIVVEKLAGEDFSGAPGEIAELKSRLLSWDMYRRSLISDDFTATQVLVPLDITYEAASRPEVINGFIEIRDIAREMFAGYAEVYVTGIPIISATINESMRSDLVLMVPLVVLVVLIVLFLSFRRFTPVILPLLTVLVAVIWSVGAMPLAGIKLSVVSSVLPVILVAVGSAYGIHVVTHYLEEAGKQTGISREEHRALILGVLGKIGKAVFLAALTTLAGFSSFCFTSVMPIREFGFFSSFGVLVSFATAMTLIPALFIIRGPKPITTGTAARQTRGDDVISGFFFTIARQKGAVIFLTLAVAGISLYGVTKVVIDNIFVEYFKTTTDIARSDKFIREKFGGSKILSVVLQSEDPRTLLMPETLSAMDNLGNYLETRIPETGKVMGFTDLVKRINQVFNVDESPEGKPVSAAPVADSGDFGFEDSGFGDFGFSDSDSFNGTAVLPSENGGVIMEEKPFESGISAGEMVRLLRQAASSGKNRSMDAGDLVREAEKLVNFEGASYYEVPVDPGRYGKTSPEELRQLVSNYLILLSGNISSYANDPLEPTAIKTTVQLRTTGDDDTGRAVSAIRRYIDDNFPENIETLVGGSALVESALNRLVVESQLISVITSILMVFLIIAVSNRSVIAGIIGVVPLSISILINFAVMGFLGIKLNIGTSMVASVSVGIGIDYTIHYIEAYKREYLAARGEGEFLRRTFTVSGKAILINAVSVGAGFAVLLFSRFVMLEDLGLLIALTMGTSALVSLTVIPVLLSVINPKFIRAEGV
jgi:predicted RND superfamily exporter protein